MYNNYILNELDTIGDKLKINEMQELNNCIIKIKISIDWLTTKYININSQELQEIYNIFTFKTN